MLSGDGNENGKKKQEQVLISKKATLHVQHTFFVHFFPFVLSDYNVELPETSWLHVLWRKCRCRSFSARWPQQLSFSHHRYKISYCSYNTRRSPLFFLSRSSSFSRSASLGVALLSLFLCLSLSLYSKFVDMTINLSLILKTTRIQKNFPLSVFVFIDSLVVSASQDVGCPSLSRQNKLTFSIGLHELLCTDRRAYATS